ncbi:hypothetical protein ABIB08_008793 [Bradyrhizobium sp. RT11b]
MRVPAFLRKFRYSSGTRETTLPGLSNSGLSGIWSASLRVLARP